MAACGSRIARHGELAHGNVRGLAQGTDQRDGGFGIQDVDVDAPAVVPGGVRGAADLAHDHRVAHFVEPLAHHGGVQRGQGDGAHDFDAFVARHADVDVRVLDVVAVQAVQQFALELLAQHGGAEAVQDQEHAHAAGVHHVGGMQGIELVLRAHHGGQGCLDGGIQGQAEGLVAVIAVVRGVDGGRGPGGGFHDGEHGAGHGITQRGPGPDLGPVQGRGQQR